jgi:hypothetical protein
MAKNTDATWIELDPSSLPGPVKDAYADYKLMYSEMKAKRTLFETALANSAGVPQGKCMVFGYNFGKLSVAIVDDDRKPAKATPAKQSLAEFIAAQQASGKRV